MNDMANLTVRDGGYYVRFIVPKDRWRDVGAALGSRTGIRRDVLKSLQTRERKTALKLRDAALEAIRRSLNLKLAEAGLPPLHGDAVPEWMNEESLVSEALEARREIAATSDRTDDGDRQMGPTDPRRRLIESMEYFLEDRAERLEKAGKDSSGYVREFREIALGERTPFALVLDRWMKDRESYASHSVISLDRATLNHFGRYLADVQETPKPPEDPIAFLRAQVIEDVPDMVLGGFAEWLMDKQGLSPKTAGNRITPLKVMWTYAIQKHILKGPNPWTGATAGLKRKAGKKKTEVRPFNDDELVLLLQSDPDEGRKWVWGPAIRDMMRLALLTGARQNELATLTVGRVINRDGAEGPLWGIQVTDDEAKTKNSIRRIPIHPLIQPVIARRLMALDESDKDAPLFPECKPGGPGMKRGYYFAKRFPDFRRRVLGHESDHVVDFHSFRRCFITFFEQAHANGAQACTAIVRDRLVGHESKSLAGNTYAAKDLGWELYCRAILGVVEKGLPSAVLKALEVP
ncbi:hypothetical protein [Gluconobacter oxydans]|uniref:hypothetical protein n=1 Tax=Gluconobacter oxydans TaxID=442 RepID=UPI0039E7C782